MQALFQEWRSLIPKPPCSFALGRIKEEHQKVVIPAMTVLLRRNLPEKERDFADQEENLALICCSRGSQLRRVSFFLTIGTPRYFIGKDLKDSLHWFYGTVNEDKKIIRKGEMCELGLATVVVIREGSHSCFLV
ncbi:unnamed protein product [Brassica oleracea var. botrytis]